MTKKKISLKNKKNLLFKKIQDVYRHQLEHQIDNISCKLFDRILIVTLEGTITSPEKLLKNNDRLYLAKEVRAAIDSVIHPQIQAIIEEVLEVKVVDFLSDTTIDNDLTGAIAIFEFKPNNYDKN